MPAELLEKLHRVRDRVLDNALISAGDVVVDVGCGDGLIAFGAIERVGKDGQVIFTDLSAELVGHCRATADELGLLDRCKFLVAPAHDLRQIGDHTADCLTTRSVLIYVADKAGAISEFFRVLRPGGRMSVGEPINQFTYPERPGVFLGYNVSSVLDIAAKLEAFFDREEQPKITAMMDFNERDLVDVAESAGFGEIHLELTADIKPTEPIDWKRFLSTAGNPLSPTLADAMATALTPPERDRFTAELRPLVESGRGTERRAFAYLRATKPGT